MGADLYPNVERLARAIGRNFHRLEVDGFDELMTELAIETGGCMRGPRILSATSCATATIHVASRMSPSMTSIRS